MPNESEQKTTQFSEAATLPPGNSAANPVGAMHNVGDYELLEELARGGMGVVFRARQLSLNRPVALKMILSGEYASTADRERFRREGEAAANLDHPHILPIYDVGEHEGRPFFSMKLAEGGSLTSKMSEFKDQPRRAATLMQQLADAVHFAHQRGILHRDLKPANILLDQSGQPLITDFGLAKKVGTEDGLTHTGAIVGTPAYMSPEQAKAEKQVTTSTDVYALGAILYEMLASRPPFRAGTSYETILQVIEQPPADPSTVNPQANRDLSAIAMKCLEKQPGQRYASAQGLADDLQRWLRHEPIVARPLSFWALAARWIRRHAISSAATIMLGLLAGLVGILIIFALRRDDGYLLLPPQPSWLHPITWMHAAGTIPALRWLVIILALVIVFGTGWLVQLIVRPKTVQAALAAAATLALLAMLVSYSLIFPGAATDVFRRSEFSGYHPIDSDNMALYKGETLEVSRRKKEEYLRQFLAPGTPREQEASHLSDLEQRARSMNTMHAVLVMSGILLIFLTTIYFTIALHSTWAAHHLVHSGRGWLACVACYVELYVPVLCFMILSISFIGTIIVEKTANVVGNADELPWIRLIQLTLWLSLSCVLVYAHWAVIHRHKWWLRLAAFVLVFGIIAWLLRHFAMATAARA